MVEVVGTAPTSVMVITKFVYRRSWQANTITIKAFESNSIKNIGFNFKNLFFSLIAIFNNFLKLNVKL